MLIYTNSRFLYVHVASQACYVIASFYLFIVQRPVAWWGALLLLSAGAYYVGWKLSHRGETQPGLISLSSIAIGNSVFLNLDSADLWPYIGAVVIGLTARFALAPPGGRHPYNPSVIGALAMIMMFPAYASYPTWAQVPWLQILILSLGTLTAFLNRRWILSFSYLGGFAVASVACWLATTLLGNPGGVSALFWPSLLATPASLIFTFHVITDPVTSPGSRRGQLLFGASIGITDAILRVLGHVLVADLISYCAVQLVWWAATVKQWSLPGISASSASTR